jgi:coronin-1B/1C/6
MPFWSDNNILFLGELAPPFLSLLWPLIRTIAGKGDGNIRYYEYESDNLYALDEHKSSDPQRGMCFVPRRAVNTSECEIARAYKLTSNAIEPIAFIVPRKVKFTALPRFQSAAEQLTD